MKLGLNPRDPAIGTQQEARLLTHLIYSCEDEVGLKTNPTDQSCFSFRF